MKVSLSYAMRTWGIYAVMMLISLLFLAGTSGSVIMIILNVVLFLGFLLVAFNEGAYNGEKACTLEASLEKQLKEGRAEIENEYSRAVAPEGNPLAKAMIGKYLEPVDTVWRGLGEIPKSGLGIRKEYADFDAIQRFGIEFGAEETPTGCRCGEVIRGKLHPQGCPMFGKVCTPEDPVGPCMVSSEGACAAAYKYGTV